VKTIAGIPPVRTIAVRSGRKVGYYDYGDPNGVPVFALHGTPSCGAGFDWVDEPAHERGLRVLAPDRAGIGLSDPLPRRPVVEYASELADLADAFGFDRFAVLGYSGGGPYACAAAYALGPRLTAVGVAAGMGQIGVWAQPDDFEGTDTRFLGMSLQRPWLARAVLRATNVAANAFPKQALATFAKELTPDEAAFMQSFDEPRAAIALFTQAFLRGASGVVDDYAALAQPWGFDVAQIDVPLRVWQGDADTMVPYAHATDLVERVPNATLTVWPDEGHLALVNHIGDVLDDLRG
jgi:pimeloyl-ACP methyl ester carboxylesterase